MDLEKLVIIGNAEWCALPELNVPAIRARIDSGAKTSSVHAINIEEFYKKKERWVKFEIHPLRKHTEVFIVCRAKVVDYRLVKSSSGEAKPRYVIQTDLQLGDQKWKIEVTLANRKSMGYQMLLGREAMMNRVLINPSEGYRLTRYSRKEIRVFYGIPAPEKLH